MSDCCSNTTQNTTARYANCPRCIKRASQVTAALLLHQIRAPFNRQLPLQTFYFCSTKGCDVVYFTLTGSQLMTEQVRALIGQKSEALDRPLCYCFDVDNQTVTQEIQQLGHSPSYHFVVEQTKLKNCACDIRNPSGKCCLKDFPKAAKKLTKTGVISC